MITPVGLPPLMVVSFEVDREFEVAFNDFYNKKFLPELLSLSPELRSIQRFETFHPETMAATGSYLTFYQLDCLDRLDKTDAIFGKAEFSETLSQFRQFKERALLEFSRVNYEPIYNVEAPTASSGLQGVACDYCWMVQINVARGREEVFVDWYLESYLAGILAQAPELSACHVFKACEPAFLSILTIYQAADECSLKSSLQALEKVRASGEAKTMWASFCRDLTVVRLGSQGLRSILTLP